MSLVRDLKYYLKQWHLAQRLSDTVRFPQLRKLLDIHFDLVAGPSSRRQTLRSSGRRLRRLPLGGNVSQRLRNE